MQNKTEQCSLRTCDYAATPSKTSLVNADGQVSIQKCTQRLSATYSCARPRGHFSKTGPSLGGFGDAGGDDLFTSGRCATDFLVLALLFNPGACRSRRDEPPSLISHMDPFILRLLPLLLQVWHFGRLSRGISWGAVGVLQSSVCLEVFLSRPEHNLMFPSSVQ